MSEKKVTLKQWNGNNYDEIFPKTIPEQIANLSTNIISIAQSNGFTRMDFASYTGTGVSGSSVTLSQTPKLCFIFGSDYYGNRGAYIVSQQFAFEIVLCGEGSQGVLYTDPSSGDVVISGNTLQLMSRKSYNYSGSPYRVFFWY